MAGGGWTDGRSPHRLGLWRGLVTDQAHGSLPVLLLGLTVLTGVVDATSILSLGRVFVANMTGNVVFVGFALAGAVGFSLAASLAALAGFLVGAFGGGRAVRRVGYNRATLLRDAVACELVLVGAAFVIAVVAGTPLAGAVRDVLAALLAVAMGLQNAVARKLAVPDLTTTVLTMTLTGIAADASTSGYARRLLAVAAMLGGGVGGAVLVLNVSAVAALALAVAILLAVTTGASMAARRPAAWQTPSTTAVQRTNRKATSCGGQLGK
jgi:uncharacterized membrane protein YoaK (UPF0700 family)